MKEKEMLGLLATKWGISAKDAAKFLDDFVTVFKDGLKANGEVTLNALGKFVCLEKPARTGRNPMTGETIQIAAKKVAKWKPNKKFKDEMFG